MIIRLEGLEFFAHHGYYEEEQKIGNKYTVDIEICLNGDADYSQDIIEDTINYEEVYDIVKEVMISPTKLLEALADRINKKIKAKFPHIEYSNTTVSKHNPPIKGICKKASVSLRSL